MKIVLLFSTLLFFSCSKNYESQILENNKDVDYDLYDIVLNDSVLFFFPEDKFSDIKYFVNKTSKWDSRRFYLTAKNKVSEFLYEDELSDKNTTYLFTEAENLISNKEQKALAEYSQKIIPEFINHNFINLKPININDSFKGMCIEITKPIYSANGSLAFLDIYLHKNLSETSIDTTTYYEKIGFILKKKENGNWELLQKKLWIML